MQILDHFVRFLNRSPTAFHAAKEITNALAEADFTPLNEKEKWKFEPGRGYFLTRGDTLVAAFRLPKQAPSHATILASHLDSPCLKLKPHIEGPHQSIGQLNTEVYGAPILHSWLDRDLYIAGRIIALGPNQKRSSHLVSLEEYPIIIPEVALHLNREVNEKGFVVHKQDHLRALFSLEHKGKSVEKLLKKQYGFETLLGFDLFLVPCEKASFLGFDSEIIASSRLDNLTASFAALFALLNTKAKSDGLQIAFFWDHEEIGSTTHLGAASRFADEVLERICLFFKMQREDFFRFKSRSLCVSGDLVHGFHPNFSDKYDPENSPFLGKGPVVKFNANQKYATSGASSASIFELAHRNKIPLQTFACKSDIPSGSTVGPIMAAELGIPTVDVGIASWAMHSIRETIAASDEIALSSLFQAILESPLHEG